MRSPVYTLRVFVLTSWIWWFWAREVWRQWRKTLLVEPTSLLFFDGQTRHEVQLSALSLARIYLSTGNVRLRQPPSQTLFLHLKEEEAMLFWDVSNFSLRVIFRALVGISQYTDLPPVDVYYLAVSTADAGVCGSARGLSTLAPVPQESLDANEEKRSDWEQRIEELQRHVRFTPNSNLKENTL